ncbi:MAG: copper oxidase [Thermoanaerobaculia bacterium]|nr:copper oxidase [Thermoanaerobaculia bacterium]
MISRRTWLSRAALIASGAALVDRARVALGGGAAWAQEPHAGHSQPEVPPATDPRSVHTPAPPPARVASGNLPYTPVITPNGSTLPFVMKDGVKEFHLVAEPVEVEFAPGMKVNAWGYNGSAPGPTIEAVEGDRVRFVVENRLPEHTTIHWHGILLPAGMDGVGGLNQPQIQPGETYVYEFTLRQHGTHLYHPHADEMVQMAMGMMGFFIIHPRRPERRIDRDFCLFPHMFYVRPGTKTPDAAVMLDFNLFTFNGKVYPGTEALVCRLGDRTRIRLANLSMTSHPIHLHGHQMWVTETDGGQIPRSAWWPETTVNVFPGTTRAFEFVADNPGDWALHCHKTHHTMNAMGHDVPNLLGVDQKGVSQDISRLVKGYMAMGSTGMAEHAAHSELMPGVPNTLPMMTGTGPFGPIEMGGMFTVLKIRESLASYEDPGWYDYPEGTVARRVGAAPTGS